MVSQKNEVIDIFTKGFSYRVEEKNRTQQSDGTWKSRTSIPQGMCSRHPGSNLPPINTAQLEKSKKAVTQRACCEVALLTHGLPEGNEFPLGLIPHYWSSHLRPGVSPSATKLVAPYSWPWCFPNPVLPFEEKEIKKVLK